MTSPPYRCSASVSGVFVAELREALVAARSTSCGPSYKDLPTAQPDDLTIAAVPTREDPPTHVVAPATAWCFGELPPRIADRSARRPVAARSFARFGSVDLRVSSALRGNIDHPPRQCGRVVESFDAIVIARAGLSRIGRTGASPRRSSRSRCCPRRRRARLAVECRSDNRISSRFSASSTITPPVPRWSPNVRC
ncbi:hypothetical protein GS540_27045, partial [Rhodococcus hoagii]|nr:hypothetical protein [Prescottella equi]